MRIKLKNVRPLAKRGKRVGDEDDLLAYLMNSNNTVYSPTGGYNVQFAPTAENRDYQAVGLPAAQIVGQSPNPQARYVNQLANQISQQQGVGNNNDYFRTVGILNNIIKDKKYVSKDGALNQQGWAKLAQDQMFGPGSDWYKRHSQSAKDIASGLAQVAMLPYAAGMGGLELLGSVGGGALGATIGSNIGQNFDNPYSGNYAGSELGGLFGGLIGGAAGANIRGLGQAYIKGMNNLMNKQDLYWASRGYKLNGTKPTSAEIEAISSEPTAKIRTKVGDIEIDDPTLSYRQGSSSIIDDFYKTGKVSTPKGNYGKRIVGRFNFGKSFSNPMFRQGSLWYGLDPAKPGLLVTKEPLALANKSSAMVDIAANGTPDIYNVGRLAGRRIPMSENQLNTSNTIGYNYVPGYGYRHVLRTNNITGFPKNSTDLRTETQRFGDRLADIWENLDDFEGYHLPISNFKYGGRVKRPFGGGIPEGVPFVEGPVAYNPQYNGLWAPTAPIRNASPIDIMGGRPVVRGPIAGNIISSLGTPIDELELNSWRTNAVGNPNTYALSTEQRPIKRAVNLNSRNNTGFNTSRTEQSWLNRRTPNKPLKISTARYNAGRALGAVSKAIPYYYGIELATASGEPHYDAEGYLIDNITGERLESEPRHTPKVGKRLAKIQRQVNNAVSKYNQLQYSNNNNVGRTSTNNNTNTRVNTNAKPEQANTTAQQTAKQPVNKPAIQTNTKQSDIQTKTVVSDKTSIPKNEDYTVVRGDSPWKIADKAGITLNTLYELNPGMEKRGVYVGDKVNLTRNITSDQQIEKVTKRGDSPWAIAHRYGMTLDEFYKLNPNAKSRGVYIGDEVVVNKNRNQKKYGGAVRRRLESGGQLSY